MSDPPRPTRGRPRKHATAADRVRASRMRRNLVKLTIDVPASMAKELQRTVRARKLQERRGYGAGPLQTFDWADSALSRCDCAITHLHAQVKEMVPKERAAWNVRNTDIRQWQWEIFDAGMRKVAVGIADRSLAKAICEAIMRAHHEQ